MLNRDAFIREGYLVVNLQQTKKKKKKKKSRVWVVKRREKGVIQVPGIRCPSCAQTLK